MFLPIKLVKLCSPHHKSAYIPPHHQLAQVCFGGESCPPQQKFQKQNPEICITRDQLACYKLFVIWYLYFRETNSLVEEFMLLANISTAKKIYEHFPQYAVLRCHPIPSQSMFETLIKSAASVVSKYDDFDCRSSMIPPLS